MNKRTTAFILAIVGFAPLQIYLVAGWLPTFLRYSGGISNLDSRFGYGYAEVNELLNALGEAGIRHYVLGSCVDIVYALFMGLVIFTLFRLIQGERMARNVFTVFSAAVPVAYVCFDWIENAGILTYLSIYPKPAGHGVAVFSFFTTLKQLMPLVAGAYLAFVVVLRFVYLVRDGKGGAPGRKSIYAEPRKPLQTEIRRRLPPRDR